MFKLFNPLLVATVLIVTVQSSHAMNLDLAAKSDKMLSNNTPLTIHATCQIHGGKSKKTIKIQGVRNTSQVNGYSLNAGQTTSMSIYQEKTVEVIAEPGAQVTIMNLSDESIEAVCST